MPSLRDIIVLAGFLVLIPSAEMFADDEAAQRQFFESKIRPLLVEKCQSCHEGKEPESKFRVDSLEGLLQGGIRGAGIVPGKPVESLLISAVKHGEILKMPPKEKLPASQIADLVKWIESGAYWPDAMPTAVVPAKSAAAEPEFTPEQRGFWAFQRPQRPVIPEAIRPGDFRSPIDRFLDVKLAQAGFTPALPADKRILMRRAVFDLTGLPPTPEEFADFLADDSPDAFERLLDRLLASPSYGEKWGRHWLDVARYGDSNGLDENLAFGNAYRYRDYVVAAFNQDKSYDEFVREQIAGDLLGGAEDRLNASEATTLERIVATAFLTIGPKMLAEDDPVKMEMDILDEQVETLGKAFLGMTFGCARCHHHKFDPISTQDYYGLAGIFKSTRTMENFGVVARWQERPLATGDELRKWTEHQNLLAAANSQIQQLVTTVGDRIATDARRHLGDYLLAAAQQELWESRQPIGNRPDAAKLPGVILLEAENFARGNVLKDTEGFGKEIGVLVNQGEKPNFAEYDLELPQTGRYQIELRYAAMDARPCRLSVNSKVLKADAAGKITGGWHPQQQAWHNEGVYELPGGKIVLRLEHPVYFPHIDKLLIAPASTLSPNGASQDIPSPESFVKVDAGYTVVPTYVQQWRKTLFQPPAELPEALAPWLEVMKQFTASPTSETLKSLQQAALNYQRAAERVVAEKLSDEPVGKILFDPKGPFATPKDQEAGFPPETVAELKTLREEKSVQEAALRGYPTMMAVSEQTPANLRIHIRGSHLTLGELVPRRFPKSLGGETAAVGSHGSGRLELAEWITRPDHPLTARVIVNRLWTWHFGQGIVRSVDNFGLLGEPPTHPELLDWLATEFPRQAWSVKRFHRTLMSSATYQRSGRAEPAQFEHDPDNRLWGRFSRRRLDIEELRDGILSVAGTLDARLGGRMLTMGNRDYVTSTANVNPEMYRTNRRSIYLPVIRSALFEVFQAFDFADPNVSNGLRQMTTVPPQALFLMNSEFVAQQTLAWAETLLSDTALPDEARIKLVYRQALSREPTVEEIAKATQFLADYAADVTASTSSAEGRRRAWQSFCRALLSTNEFVFVE